MPKRKRNVSSPRQCWGVAGIAIGFYLAVRRLSKVSTITTSTIITHHNLSATASSGHAQQQQQHHDDVSCSLWQSTTAANVQTLNDDCIQQIARVYPMRYENDWCLPPSNHPNTFLKRPQQIATMPANSIVGLIFVKNTKAASSTGAGVTLRIAEQVGHRVLAFDNNATTLAATSCVRNWTHAFANFRGHGKLLPDKSVLWTALRQPSSRDISAFFFFEHARNGVEATDDNIINYLQHQKSGQFRYLHTEFIADHNLHPDFQQWYAKQTKDGTLSTILQRLLQAYDFIALVERWDESLAVLTLLWNLEVGDVLVLSAKTKGGYDDGKFRQKCHAIPQPQLSEGVRHHLQSADYRNDNLDFALYAAANASLDQTIAALGKNRVEERRRLLRTWQTQVEAACQKEAVFPCSSTGKLQRAAARKSCYIDDSGCGHACVDRVLQQLKQLNP